MMILHKQSNKEKSNRNESRPASNGMKKLYSYIILSSIIILPMSAHASFGDWVRGQIQNVNTELDSAGSQIATIIWPWDGNLENGAVPLDWRVVDDMQWRDSDDDADGVNYRNLDGDGGMNAGPNAGPNAGQGTSINVPRDITPTFCNIEILLPEANQTIPSSFSTAGLVGQPYQTDACRWTVFEGNSGNVQVFDADDNAVSQRKILQSVGDWMQFPSSFEANIILTAIPHTQTGHIRYIEDPVQDGVIADTFDLPIRFEVWQAPRLPSEQTMWGRFFTTITNLFTGKPKVTPPPKDTVSQKPQNQTPKDLPGYPSGDGDAEIVNSIENSNFTGQLYCEINLPDKTKFCSGNRIDAGTCRCETFYLSDGVQKPENEKVVDSVLNIEIGEALIVPQQDISLTKTLYFGDRGEEVRMLESALYYLGYYDKTPLGLFSNDVRLALRAFTESKGKKISGFIITKEIRDMINQEAVRMNNPVN